jgi:hypothetical protein
MCNLTVGVWIAVLLYAIARPQVLAEHVWLKRYGEWYLLPLNARVHLEVYLGVILFSTSTSSCPLSEVVRRSVDGVVILISHSFGGFTICMLS